MMSEMISIACCGVLIAFLLAVLFGMVSEHDFMEGRWAAIDVNKNCFQLLST